MNYFLNAQLSFRSQLFQNSELFVYFSKKIYYQNILFLEILDLFNWHSLGKIRFYQYSIKFIIPLFDHFVHFLNYK
jgi:hypothetical protein